MRLVIAGGGFGGVYTILNLKKFLLQRKDIELVLIDQNDYFLFKPLLDEIVVGNIKEDVAIVRFEKLFKYMNIKLLRGNIGLVNLEEKFLIVNEKEKITFDYLVISLGATTNFYGVPGAEEFSFRFSSLDEMKKLRDYISNLDHKETIDKLVVVGGGATGVQLASKINFFLRKIKLKKIEIILIEKGKRILSNFGDRVSNKCYDFLSKNGIKIFLEKEVTEIGENYIRLDSGDIIEKAKIIWTAGVKPNLPKIVGNLQFNRRGQIVVNRFFQVKNYENVFALGDVISFEDINVPQSAQAAVKEAKYLAQNLKNIFTSSNLKLFRYYHAGDLIPLKRFYVAANIRGLQFFGFLPWLMWKIIYIVRALTWRQRFSLILNFFRF
ncbi:MAG: FAD-dependent oxidoreductase [Patescibacteria group bacterium]|nr:FAD-dependent oxidoreductase [Patescibacteria group bacterium]